MNFTKRNSGGFGTEFVWRGLTFEWDGRRYHHRRIHELRGLLFANEKAE